MNDVATHVVAAEPVFQVHPKPVAKTAFVGYLSYPLVVFDSVYHAHLCLSDRFFSYLSACIIAQAACAVNYYFSRSFRQHRQDRHNPTADRRATAQEKAHE